MIGTCPGRWRSLSKLTDAEFLALKQRYYRDRALGPKVASGGGPAGGANNQEQLALCWGYEHGLADMRTRVLQQLGLED